MSTHSIIQRSFMTAFVLSLTSIASAHVFSKPQTKAEITAERAALCRAALTIGKSAKPTFARFGPPRAVTTGTGYRVVGFHRFGGGTHVPAVACTHPMGTRYVGCR